MNVVQKKCLLQALVIFSTLIIWTPGYIPLWNFWEVSGRQDAENLRHVFLLQLGWQRSRHLPLILWRAFWKSHGKASTPRIFWFLLALANRMELLRKSNVLLSAAAEVLFSGLHAIKSGYLLGNADWRENRNSFRQEHAGWDCRLVPQCQAVAWKAQWLSPSQVTDGVQAKAGHFLSSEFGTRPSSVVPTPPSFNPTFKRFWSTHFPWGLLTHPW